MVVSWIRRLPERAGSFAVQVARGVRYHSADMRHLIPVHFRQYDGPLREFLQKVVLLTRTLVELEDSRWAISRLREKRSLYSRQ